MRIQRVALVAGLLAVLALGFTGGASAQDRFTIKIGWVTPDSPKDPYATGAHTFKQAVERQSKGRIDVQLFPNRQLGDEKPMLEGLRFGTIDAAVITNAVVAQIEPAFQAAAVEHRDRAAAVADQLALLQCPRSLGDADPAHAQHEGEEFMGDM